MAKYGQNRLDFDFAMMFLILAVRLWQDFEVVTRPSAHFHIFVSLTEFTCTISKKRDLFSHF